MFPSQSTSSVTSPLTKTTVTAPPTSDPSNKAAVAPPPKSEVAATPASPAMPSDAATLRPTGTSKLQLQPTKPAPGPDKQETQQKLDDMKKVENVLFSDSLDAVKAAKLDPAIRDVVISAQKSFNAFYDAGDVKGAKQALEQMRSAAKQINEQVKEKTGAYYGQLPQAGWNGPKPGDL